MSTTVTPERIRRISSLAAALCLGSVSCATAADPIDIGSRRELFVDQFLIERIDNVRLKLNEPRNEGEVFRFDKPWEGAFCTYSTVIRDGEKFRLYYRGKTQNKADGVEEVTCCAESRDGVHWTRPSLGLHTIGGSKENNVMITEPKVTHNFSPLLDTRPDVPANERYKALGGVLDKTSRGLVAFASADGVHWRRLATEPVITKGSFDSQNVAFWSESEKCYVAYFRTFTKGITTGDKWQPAGLRSVSRATSSDFLHWSDAEPMQFTPTQTQHIYVSQTHPYFRAPHLYVGTAARFVPGRLGITLDDARDLHVDPSYFKAAKDSSDAVLLTSRGGNRYDQTFREAFVRPGLRREQWVSRSNYPALNVVQTGPAEMSCYVNTDYAQPTAHLRRYSWRLDGFASVNAPFEGGEFVTKPLTFDGTRLLLNFSTSAAGGIRIEVQDAAGRPIPGFALADSVELFGDSIERAYRWKSGDNVSALSGKTVRLRFVMKDADLFALRFEK